MDLTEAAQAGWDAPAEGTANPWFTTSPRGLAWLAGRWLRVRGLQRPAKAAASRGYRVRINGHIVLDCDPAKAEPEIVAG
jgi:hypothetical protein